MRTKRLVAPKTFVPGYPDGADYFELARISDGDPITVYYYYFPNVDDLDEAKLRTPDHLVRLRLKRDRLEH